MKKMMYLFSVLVFLFLGNIANAETVEQTDLEKAAVGVIKYLQENELVSLRRCCINISNLLINNNFSKICKNYN